MKYKFINENKQSFLDFNAAYIIANTSTEAKDILMKQQTDIKNKFNMNCQLVTELEEKAINNETLEGTNWFVNFEMLRE